MSAVRIYWLTFALILVVTLVTVFAAWGVMTYTGSPTFCASCHIMETRYRSWQRSSHWGKATCIECHSEPDAWGEFRAHLNGTRYLYVMLTGEKSGAILRAEVESATCSGCHPTENLPEATRTHRVFHSAHLASGMECAACHAGLVHGTLSGGQERPSMSVCVNCHEKKSPILIACRSCHIRPLTGGSLARRTGIP